jgi:protein-L-isoaspartate(D-aspartate) O-methyltransferase
MRAMGKVPWHEFVPIELQSYAHANRPLPIGFNKTIWQPFIVALMTDLLEISADNTVLEIGTGLGYQTAILAELVRKVYSIEIIEELGQQAKKRLRREGCTNAELKIANGYHGWSEYAASLRSSSSSDSLSVVIAFWRAREVLRLAGFLNTRGPKIRPLSLSCEGTSRPRRPRPSRS